MFTAWVSIVQYFFHYLNDMPCLQQMQNNASHALHLHTSVQYLSTVHDAICWQGVFSAVIFMYDHSEM